MTTSQQRTKLHNQIWKIAHEDIITPEIRDDTPK